MITKQPKVVNFEDIEGDCRSEQGMREKAISTCRNRSPISEKLHSRVAKMKTELLNMYLVSLSLRLSQNKVIGKQRIICT